jgi:hypothetical protein
MYRTYLILAGTCNIIIALVHFAAIIIGQRAYEFLDAPSFAEMAVNGSLIPSISTFFVALLFLFLARYSFSSAGFGRKLTGRFFVLTTTAWLFIIRGLAVIPYSYFYISDSIHNNPNEIWFSLIFLIVGLFTHKGRMNLLLIAVNDERQEYLANTPNKR